MRLPLLTCPRLAGRELTGGGAVLVATGRRRPRPGGRGRRAGGRPLLAGARVAGLAALARLPGLAGLGASGRPLAGAVGARPGRSLVVIRAVTAEPLGPRAAGGGRG